MRWPTVFGAGVDLLLRNVVSSLTLTSTLSAASTTVLGLVSGLVMWLGGHAVLDKHWTIGDYFAYNLFLAFMIAPVFQSVRAAVMNLGQADLMGDGIDYTVRAPGRGLGWARKC